MNKITTVALPETTVSVIGIDLAKNVFALHGINSVGRPVLVRPSVRREQLLALLAQLPPRVIGTQACSGAHHWARHLIKLGHNPKLMATKFVSRYRMQVKRGKKRDPSPLLEGEGVNGSLQPHE